jgi:hypothetical protein
LKPVQPEDLAARSDTVVRKQHSAADFMASSPNAKEGGHSIPLLLSASRARSQIGVTANKFVAGPKLNHNLLGRTLI